MYLYKASNPDTLAVVIFTRRLNSMCLKKILFFHTNMHLLLFLVHTEDNLLLLKQKTIFSLVLLTYANHVLQNFSSILPDV